MIEIWKTIEEYPTYMVSNLKHKSVCQLLNNQIIATYHSVKEATMNTGINSSNIVQVCKGDRQTAGGYTWRYAS